MFAPVSDILKEIISHFGQKVKYLRDQDKIKRTAGCNIICNQLENNFFRIEDNPIGPVASSYLIR